MTLIGNKEPAFLQLGSFFFNDANFFLDVHLSPVLFKKNKKGLISAVTCMNLENMPSESGDLCIYPCIWEAEAER